VPFLKEILLKRSIFDILCDIWYLPKILLYLKAFFGPFIFNIVIIKIIIKNSLHNKHYKI